MGVEANMAREIFMIKKTKRQMAGLLIVVYLLFLIFILLIYSFLLRKEDRIHVSKELTVNFKILAEQETDSENEKRGRTPPPDQEMENRADKNTERADLSEPLRIHTVYRSGKDLSVYSSSIPDGMKEEQILQIARGILTQKKQSGIWSHYQYEISIWNEGFLIGFTDVAGIYEKEHMILYQLIAAGMLTLCLWSVFSFWLSKVLVRPMETAMKKQSDFMLAAGHELKTPIAVIRTSHAMMRQEGIRNKYLAYAEEELESMGLLVQEMLEISRLETDEVSSGKARFDFSKCIEGAALPFEAIAYEKGLRLEITVEPEMTFYGNEVQLKRLVGILIDNAIGHTESGHEIIVSLKKEERKTVLSVKNQGEPIPLHEQKKIFEQFYQTDSSRHREKGRYGLGLSIAAEIAKKHQTDIKIRCQNGWTEFYLFFS